MELKDIKISKYIKMLKDGNSPEQIIAIDNLLQKTLSNTFDINKLLIQKDLLVFQCKFAIAFFEQNDEDMQKWTDKINQQRDLLIDKKAKKVNPYIKFLSWVISVEKHLGFAIDKKNDLLYFVEATKQMLAYVDSQKK
jgi:hypothetical protein